MRAEILLQDDTTTLFLRWEIVFEGGELARLKALGGPLLLRITATNYVDDAGKFHPTAEVEVPIYPHAGKRNQMQAKFTSFESRRAFLERLQQTILGAAAELVASAPPGSIPVEGHVFSV